MFRKQKESPEDQADLLGERLLGGVPEIADLIFARLHEETDVRPSAEDMRQLLIEFFVFYMHMLDRMAFQSLGRANRDRFVDRLIVTVANGITSGLNESLSAVDFVAQFRDTFNKRQLQYAAYPEMLPPKDEPLKGTLFWEFSKILFDLAGDTNPATLILISVLVSNWTVFMLDEALQAKETLKS